MLQRVRNKLILLDNNLSNLAVGKDMLMAFYDVYPAPSVLKVFDILKNTLPDLILVDTDMPEMLGYRAIKMMKADPRLVDVPLILLTSKSDEKSELAGFSLGVADYILKPVSWILLRKRITDQLVIVRQKKELLVSRAAFKAYADNLEKMTHDKEVAGLQHAILTAVSDLVEFRDRRTGGHIIRTRHYLEALITGLAQEDTYMDELMGWNLNFFLPSAILHDVGKIAISDHILNKPAKLTEEEFEIMKTHVTVGVDAIEKIMSNAVERAFLHHALLIAGTHHEKWDGSGYPMGLKGSKIPLEGRLMAIADVYDALISTRPYKKAFSVESACRIIEHGSGSHFDPMLVKAFRRVEGEFARVVREVEC